MKDLKYYQNQIAKWENRKKVADFLGMGEDYLQQCEEYIDKAKKAIKKINN